MPRRVWLLPAATAALAVLTGAVAQVLTNYATVGVPGWFQRPWHVWPVLGGVVALLVVVAILAARREHREPGSVRDGAAEMLSQRIDTVQAGVVIGPGSTVHLTHPTADRSPHRLTADQVVIGQLPREPPAYQNRTEVMAALAAAAADGKVAVVCAVTGQRGIGKTQLVAAYARDRVRDGWPLVAWIAADSEDQLLTGLDTLATALGLRSPGEDFSVAVARLRAYLNTCATPALLVFDNVVNADLLPGYLPASGSVQVVLTSSLRSVERLGQPIPVDLFSPAESCQYLADATGLDDPDGSLTVAEELGHLPLALAQAAAVLRGQHLGFATYLQRLRTIPVSQYLTRRSGEPYPLGTAEAILLSLHEAGFATDPATGDLLRLLSVLSPDGVHRGLLSTTGEASGVDGLLDRLGEASIVAVTVDGVSVTMHRLVQRVIRDTALHEGSYHQTLTSAVARLDANLFDERDGWRRRGDGAQLVANIKLLWAHSHAPLPESLAALPERLLRLRRWAVRQLLAAADLDRAITLGNDVLTDCRRLLGAEHPSTLTSANNLAYAYESAGQLDRAIPLYETTLTERRRLLGAEHPLCRTLADNLRRARLRHAGRYWLTR